MFEWIAPVVISIVGAGAGTVFTKVFDRSPKVKMIPLPEKTADVMKALMQMREWEEKVDKAIQAQQRQISRLKREVRVLRLVLDFLLILLLTSLGFWYYINKAEAKLSAVRPPVGNRGPGVVATH